MISMIEPVMDALKSDMALNELVNNKIFWMKPATSQELPYVTYFEVSNSEAESADDEEYAADIEIQVDIWNSGSTIPIAKEVQRIMRKLGFIHQALPDSYEKETKIFHKAIRFTITKET